MRFVSKFLSGCVISILLSSLFLIHFGSVVDYRDVDHLWIGVLRLAVN